MDKSNVTSRFWEIWTSLYFLFIYFYFFAIFFFSRSLPIGKRLTLANICSFSPPATTVFMGLWKYLNQIDQKENFWKAYLCNKTYLNFEDLWFWYGVTANGPVKIPESNWPKRKFLESISLQQDLFEFWRFVIFFVVLKRKYFREFHYLGRCTFDMVRL